MPIFYTSSVNQIMPIFKNDFKDAVNPSSYTLLSIA